MRLGDVCTLPYLPKKKSVTRIDLFPLIPRFHTHPKKHISILGGHFDCWYYTPWMHQKRPLDGFNTRIYVSFYGVMPCVRHMSCIAAEEKQMPATVLFPGVFFLYEDACHCQHTDWDARKGGQSERLLDKTTSSVPSLPENVARKIIMDIGFSPDIVEGLVSVMILARFGGIRATIALLPLPDSIGIREHGHCPRIERNNCPLNELLGCNWAATSFSRLRAREISGNSLRCEEFFCTSMAKSIGICQRPPVLVILVQ
jgi:hypothetical protein